MDRLGELPQLGDAEVLASCFIVKCFLERKSYINSTKASSLPEYSKNKPLIYFSMPIHLLPKSEISRWRPFGDDVKNSKYLNFIILNFGGENSSIQ